jgi:hypothetical protein
MPKRNGKNDVDAEQDYHGMTAEQIEVDLQHQWLEWRRYQVVRIIHGQGERLRPVVHGWCADKGIQYKLEGSNSGSTLIYPNIKVPKTTPGIGTSALADALKAKGITVSPEERKVVQRSAEEERREQDRLRLVRKELERRKKANEAAEARKKQVDAQLWQAEVSRLDEVEKKRSGKRPNTDDDRKPRAPFVATRGRHTPLQEGYWRGELVRIVDTDHETLQEEKQTGLDKLAPPLIPNAQAAEQPKPQKKKPFGSQRNHDADQALFEEAMRQLEQGG